MNYIRRYFLPACLTILSGIWTTTGFAQIQDSLFQLGEVQIISGRLGITEARTGRHVTVIRADAIQQMPVNSIDELLRYLPFMEIQSRGAFGVQSDILMRGGTFNQMLVLLDGMRVNDPLTGHFNSYIPVSVIEIDRIEVYRGPASTVYGADAVGGVVNIITKSFLPGKAEDRLEGRVESWYGQHELFRTNTGFNMKKGRWKLGTGISYNASKGHPLASDSLRGDFRLGTVSLSLAVDLSENIQLAVRSAFDNRLFNAQYFYTNSPWDLSREQVKRWWNQFQLKWQLDRSNSLTLQAAYVSTTDSFLFNPAFPANLHKTRYQQYQANHLYQSESGLRIASGAQVDHKEIVSNDRGDRTHLHTGIYSMLSYTLPVELSLSGGLRLDYDEVYGIELMPQVNLAYDMREVLNELVDSQSLFELQPAYGDSMITALARMGGVPCMLIANQPTVQAGAITLEGATKACHFIQVADNFGLPLISLLDNPGVMPGPTAEKSGVLKAAGQMFLA